MSENWRLVPGLEQFYEVSDQGRVRSFARNRKGINGSIRKCPGRILSSKTTGPYPRVILTGENLSVGYDVHVLVMLAFVGPCPVGLEVCHNDGVKLNCRLENLRYDTHINNYEDLRKHNGGLMPNSGEKHYLSKLTVIQVNEIRTALAPYRGERIRGGLGAALATKYGVSRASITDIHQNKRWVR